MNGLVRNTRSGSSRSCKARNLSGPTDRAAAINTPVSQNVRIMGRSEISSPAIRYFPPKLAPGQRLLARCCDLVADVAEFFAELRHRRFCLVAVLPGAVISSSCHNFILALFTRRPGNLGSAVPERCVERRWM